MATGDPMFSPEELAADEAREEAAKQEYAKKLAQGFFKDGGVRNIVIENVEKEEKTSKAGNQYTLHTFTLKDADTSEEETLVDRDFQFVNALAPIKKQLGTDLRLGVTVLKLTTIKKGEREWNGVNYPVYAHSLELVSNPIDKLGNGVATKNAEKHEDGAIPF